MKLVIIIGVLYEEKRGNIDSSVIRGVILIKESLNSTLFVIEVHNELSNKDHKFSEEFELI